MRSVEECYNYVILRRDKLAEKRIRTRKIAVRTAVPVCSAALLAGVIFPVKIAQTNTSSQQISQGNSGEINTALPSAAVDSDIVTDISDNILNIGVVKEDDGEQLANMFYIPTIFEMTREEVLNRFGLSADLDLSKAVGQLSETELKLTAMNMTGKHGFPRELYVDENGVETWGEFCYETDAFWFENSDKSKSAEIIFSLEGRIPWYWNWILDSDEMKAVPDSLISGVKMKLACRGDSGYYFAEFEGNDISVGVVTNGLSEEETVAVLEYLAEYTNAPKAETNPEKDFSVGEISDYKDVLININ